MKMTEYRLPDGTNTEDVERLSEEWKKLYTPICEATGATVIGFNPGVLFTYKNKPFNLSVEVIQKLNAAMAAAPCERCNERDEAEGQASDGATNAAEISGMM